MRTHLAICITALWFCVPARTGLARVYWRWGSANDSAAAMKAAGGRPVYKADVNVNGGKGKLAVFAFNRLVGDVSRELARVFGQQFAATGSSMAMAKIRDSGRVIHIVVMQFGERFESLVVTFDQSEEEYNKTGGRPSEHLMRELPPYPGSRPAFYAANEDTRMSMAMADAAASSADAQQFYRNHLLAEGWEQKLPPGSNDLDKLSALSIYQRGPRVCLVHTLQSAGKGRTRITLLHKYHEDK